MANTAEAVAPAPTRRGPFRIVVLAIIVIAVLILAMAYWLHARRFETTDDAFIDGNVVRISPQVGGVVARLHFTDNQDVRKGDLLIEIDPRALDAEVAAAKAALDIALAQRDAAAASLALVQADAGAGLEAANGALDQARRAADAAKSQVGSLRAAFYRAQADLKHAQALFAQGGVTRPQLDQFQADAQSARERLAAAERSAAAVENQAEQASGRVEAAKATPERVSVAEAQLRGNEARVAQARALLRQAELNRSQAQIYAPRDGRIARKAVQEGDVVRKDQTLSLLIVGMPWVTANFKETQIGRLRLGQPAAISIDAYPGRPLLGHVESIQPGTDARFAARQAASADGEFVKSVQRVPVKIELDEAPDDNQLLALGMSVVPTVMVQNEPEPTVRVQ